MARKASALPRGVLAVGILYDLQQRIAAIEAAETAGQPRPAVETEEDKNESGIHAVVSDLHDTELFTVSRRYRAAAYEAGRNPQAVDHLISEEVVRRLEQEDWENDALYVLDDA